MRPELVVFDLDGVLVDSRQANVEAFSYGIEQLGQPRPPPDQVSGLIGLAADEMLRRLGCPPAQVARIFREYVQPRYLECIVSMARPMAGARALLEQLRAAGIRVGACTSGARDIQEPVLRALGLWPLVEHLQTPDASRRRKPDPAYLGELVEKFPGPPTRVVHVEDTQEGCLMGRRWGAVSVFAEYGYGSWTAPEQPDYRIWRLQELEPIVLGSGGG